MRRLFKLLCVLLVWALISVALVPTFNKRTATSTGTSASPRGYIVALRYYEQQTKAMHGVLKLQCFASSYGMTVLEPFIERSKFTSQISAIVEGEHFLQFRDLFDIDLWNERTARFGYPGLASWSDFLKNAPKQLITYCIRYRNQPLQKTSAGFNYRTGCDTNCYKNLNTTVQALARHGFKLVRSACANFIEYAGAVTTDSFMNNALGKYKPDEVTIVLNDFRGFFGLYRLPVLSNCGIIHYNITVPVSPSKQILEDAQKYLKLHFDNRPYVAIIARIERLVLHLKHNITSCSETVLKVLNEIETNHHRVKRFLAMDVGKFGSGGATALKPAGEVLFKAVYGNAWSFNEWEKTFELFALGNSSAYIANLQRTIASQAECLITFGGGSFQEKAELAYLRNHPDPSSQCVYHVCIE